MDKPRKITALVAIPSLTQLASLWSPPSDMIYAVVYGPLPQLEGQCLEGGDPAVLVCL